MSKKYVTENVGDRIITRKEEYPTELKNCPKCGRKMSWLEQDNGESTQWCYFDQNQLLGR